MANFLKSSLRKMINDLSMKRDMSLVRSSGMFDKDFYIEHNPDVAQSGVDPLLHYLQQGGFEGRDPGPNFSSSFYLNTYEDIKSKNLNPLLHYIKYGYYENRATGTGQRIQLIAGDFFSKLKNELNKYDIGLRYDPLTSFADKIIRYFYTRLYQQETYDLVNQVTNQYHFVPFFFNLRRLIRKLRPGILPIRIIFLAQDEGSWYYMETVYEACASDPAFQTKIINIGFQIKGTSEDSSTYFITHKINYLDGLNGKIQLELLNADLFVLSSPYDEYRPNQYNIENLLRYAQYAYIGYGIDFADRAGALSKQTFGNNTQKFAWRIFSRSQNTIDQYKKYARVPSRKVIGLGLPILDYYFKNSDTGVLPETVQENSAGKFKIIYAPHHSIYGWSTFLKYGKLIKQLVQENENCYLVFRPHPLLVFALEDYHIMSRQEFVSFFDGERTYLYDGPNYYGLFHWSNMLMSDASSFLTEYAPTRNPIIYLHRQDGWGGLDDTIANDIFNSCYVARSEDEIKKTFKQIISGEDPLRGTREHFQENISTGIFNGDAGKRIAKYLRQTLS